MEVMKINESIENIGLWLLIGVISTLIGIYHKDIIAAINNILHSRRLEIRKSGIIGIYKNRRTIKAMKSIKREIERANGEILLIGVAFPNFFRPETDFMKIIDNKLNNPTISLRILLLDPEKEYAKERAGMEKGDFTINDIKNTIEFLKQVNTRAKLTVHVYNIPPIVYGIITDKCAFIEQYLYTHPEVDMACMGAQVPLIQCKSESNFYRVLRQHFEYMWINKSNEIIVKGNN